MTSILHSLATKLHLTSEVKEATKEATNRDRHEISQQEMEELASATSNPKARSEIYSILWQRLNDTSKHWAHVTKAIDVLEFFLLHNVEGIEQELNNHASDISALLTYDHAKEASDAESQRINCQIIDKAKRLRALSSDRALLLRAQDESGANRSGLATKRTESLEISNAPSPMGNTPDRNRNSPDRTRNLDTFAVSGSTTNLNAGVPATSTTVAQTSDLNTRLLHPEKKALPENFNEQLSSTGAHKQPTTATTMAAASFHKEKEVSSEKRSDSAKVDKLAQMNTNNWSMDPMSSKNEPQSQMLPAASSSFAPTLPAVPQSALSTFKKDQTEFSNRSAMTNSSFNRTVELRSEKDKLELHRTEALNTLKKANEELSNATAAVASQEKNITTLSSELDTLRRAAAGLEANSGTASKELALLREQLANAMKQMECLTTDMQRQTLKIKESDAEAKAANERAAALSDQLNARTNELAEAERAHQAELEAQRLHMSEDKEAMEANAGRALQTLMADHDAEVAALQNRQARQLEETERARAELLQQINNLSKQGKVAEQEITRIQTSITEKNKLIESQRLQHASELEQLNSGLKKQCEAMKRDVAKNANSLDSRLTQMNIQLNQEAQAAHALQEKSSEKTTTTVVREEVRNANCNNQQLAAAKVEKKSEVKGDISQL